MTPDRARDIITRRLHPGERLIWHDAPNPWSIARQHAFVIAFICFWLIIPLTVSLGALRSGKVPSENVVAAPFSIIPLIMAAIGLGILFLTLQKVFRAWETAYGLTDKRVIIAIGASGSTDSYGPSALGSMSRSGDKISGNIIFGHAGVQNDRWNQAYEKPGLYGIREPARVEAAIYKHLLQPQNEGAPA